ncbi:MAG: hypothetical protein M9905_19180 [Rhizobiaceae bacterium]|nr:hypothetical protein [Rhizobiaceae bacterium]
MSDFWTAFIGPLLGALVGGYIASLISYEFSRKTFKIQSTYDEVRNFLSDEVTDKRNSIFNLIDDYGLTQKDIFLARRNVEAEKDLYKARKDILHLLNKYDTIMHGVKDGLYDAKIVKSTIWNIIINDHKKFEEFIQLYADKNTKGQRPLFPQIRSYRELWDRQTATA